MTTKQVITIGILVTIVINIGAVLFWKEYYRTLGHPLRWDGTSYEEWDCFFNDCKTINGNP